jgi:hypothetical protein
VSTSPLEQLVTRGRRALSVLLARLLVLAASPSAAPAQAEGRPRALKQLEREAAAAPERTFRVLVGRTGRARDADGYLAGRA